MKKCLFKILSVICAFLMVINTGSIAAFAADNGEFVLLNISGYNDSGEKSIKENNVLYIKNDTLYAPVKLFESYTMYNYDESNNAFVRAGQEFTKSNSKVVIDYSNSTVDVFYLPYQKEVYDIDYYEFGDTYFFPLAEMAAYLKASVIYVDENTISVVNSGISISDALYGYEGYDSCLDFFDISDDIFAGDEFLARTACVLGYFGETVFSFKTSNLFGEYGDYKKYLEILKNAVTNNECYEEIFNNDSVLAELLGVTDEVYNEVYKKSKEIYNMASNSVTEMFEDYKAVNSFGDESPYDNFFPEEQEEVDNINSLGKYISKADKFIDTFKFYYNFFKLNQDNKAAIDLLSKLDGNDSRALAFMETATLYGNDVVKSTVKQLYDELGSQLAEEAAKEASGDLMAGVNKVKLATSIVNAVFKAAGFDLSDNSGYNVMLADELKSYVMRNLDDENDNLNNEKNFTNMRLTHIMGLLIDIESFKMGNNLADRYGLTGYYDESLEESNKRLALLYLAKDSEKYDTVDGMKVISQQNAKQIEKLNLGDLTSISEKEAENLLKSTDDITLMNEQFSGLKVSNSGTDEIYYYPKNGYSYRLIRDENEIESQTYIDSSGSEYELSHTYCIEKNNDETGEKEIIINDFDGNLVVTDQYIYYYSNKYIQGDSYNDCFDGIDYVRTNLNGENREVLYHDDYVPFGSGIGMPPSMLVTNEYIYVSKYNIVRVDLDSKESEVVCDININELTGSDWIGLYFVYDDTYYFTLSDNQQSFPSNESLPDICYGYFKYNSKDGLEYIIEFDTYYGESEWVDNGDGTKSLKSINDYTVKMSGLDSIKYTGNDLSEEYNFSFRKENPFTNTGIYFTKNDGQEYYYSFESEKLQKID